MTAKCNRGETHGMGTSSRTTDQQPHAQQYYDSVADQYDSGFRREGDLIDRREREILREQLGDLSGKCVFDFGCGTGRMSLFHRSRGADQVVGVDLSPKMIEIAQQKCDDSAVKFLVFEAQRPSGEIIGERPYDVVTSHEVLEYFQRPAEFLEILSAHATDGGYVMFDFINRQNLSAWLKSRLSSQWRESGLGLYSMGQIKKLCHAAGLEVTAFNGVYMSWLPVSVHSRIPVLRSRWPSLERLMNSSRLLRRFLSYRVLVTARKRA